MSNKKLGLILLLIAAVSVLGFIGWKFASDFDKDGDNAPDTPVTAEQSQAVSQQTFTYEEVAKHASASDCWTVINGNVYDLTDYIPGHPGGSEILRACGIDSSSLFNERTTQDGQPVGSGDPHSSSAQEQLTALQIGVLAQ